MTVRPRQRLTAPGPVAGVPGLAAVPLVPMLLVPVLLVATAAAAGFATLDLRHVNREPLLAPAPAGGDRVELGGRPDRAPVEDAPVLDQAVLVVLIAAGLAVGIAVGWVLWRRRSALGGRRPWYRLRALRPTRVPGPAAPDGAALLAAVDEAVAQSEDDRDPRRAVIACWVRLAEAAGEAGIPRHDSDTATDLVIRLLRGYRVSEPVLAAFAEAYQLARYATHPVDEPMRTQARSALRRLRAELRPGPVPEPSRAGPG